MQVEGAFLWTLEDDQVEGAFLCDQQQPEELVGATFVDKHLLEGAFEDEEMTFVDKHLAFEDEERID